ncbi:ABC transporter ATP-binding protein [Corynebacterium kroppenstedtii]|uniref:Trehalose import ATP-binding protein SugC n=1 Tax=Corynebacterium kroppenstedtii (strain DSM 44385 / JCM 11950 / CIP 105744 / CCUG 35717) TaxID=645127 RepID=C4LKM8_CORK4|nr:sn-glycerol-3-phosphate transport system, ATP- binding protein [Corynebacterium kroppenstedtii DSM 44385]QRP10276.1 ABC transporter ATP-binding protein [Corynebacterium kroppenstedtii]
MASIRFNNVSRIYGDRKAVDNLSLDIADGEFLVVVGPSGCGKSTSLRMLAGLEPADEGSIFIGDRDATGVPPRERDAAMVFQNYALYPNMTVEGNMSFALRNRGMGKKETRRRVHEAAAMLELTDLLDRKPAALSGGQRQRVAMGRAIVRDPAVFCMDEPLSNLDAKLRVSTRSQILSLQKKLRTTTVYVTHDQVEAMTMGDRVAVLKDGVLQQVDSPRDVYQNPANTFVASFIGSPTMGLFTIDDGPIMGVRPEDWEVLSVASGDNSESTGEVAAQNAGGEGDAPVLDLTVTHNEELGAQSFAYGTPTVSQGSQHRVQINPMTGRDALAVLLPRDSSPGSGQNKAASGIASHNGQVTTADVAVGYVITVRATRTHYFDPETGNRINSPGDSAR